MNVKIGIETISDFSGLSIYDEKAGVAKLSVGTEMTSINGESSTSETEMKFHLSEFPIVAAHMASLDVAKCNFYPSTPERVRSGASMVRKTFPLLFWPEEWSCNAGWTVRAVLAYDAVGRFDGLASRATCNAEILANPDVFTPAVAKKIASVVRECPPLAGWSDAQIVQGLMIGQFELEGLLKLAKEEGTFPHAYGDEPRAHE
ncbi:MAG: hypothetical protein Q8K86_05900 [Candidatus Nanopelagicaceae bacterium]|nr:hypothetical protein [Candidatus Nanopelagicaceae bacterium]